MRNEELIKKAMKAKEFAFAPYSKFQVGAVLLTRDGKVYQGANVENSSYGLSMCAERVALFCAVSSGEKEFSKLAIVSDSQEPVTPCGACRQTLLEFDGELEIICANTEGKIKKYRLKELLPEPFRLDR